MIRSMTGFGRGEASSNGFHVIAEVRTLNSRYLDISIRLPEILQDQEARFREWIQSGVSRGKITFALTLDSRQANSSKGDIDMAQVGRVLEMLEQIRMQTGIQEKPSLSHLIHFQELFKPKPLGEDVLEELMEIAEIATQKAMNATTQMREREGGELRRDLDKQIDLIDESIARITTLASDRIPEARKRLRERLDSLLEGSAVDPARLEQEIALLAERIDINEELVRIHSHTKFFREALLADEPVGRRLNFLTQELNREFNTIGSKSYHSDISHLVVRCKEAVEQIREQVQNVE